MKKIQCKILILLFFFNIYIIIIINILNFNYIIIFNRENPLKYPRTG